MKIHLRLTALALLLSQSSFAISWVAEVKEVNTSEVKTYKFIETKTHAIEMPKVKKGGCMIQLYEKQPGPNNTPAQVADVMCMNPLGAVIMKKVCFEDKDQSLNKYPLQFQFVDDSDKVFTKKKKTEFRSYAVTITCD